MTSRHRSTRRQYQGMTPVVPLAETAEWADEGACTPAGAGTSWDPSLHFDTARVTKAVAVCATCPVIDECFDFAVRSRMTKGVWGGQDMTPGAQRKRGEVA